MLLEPLDQLARPAIESLAEDDDARRLQCGLDGAVGRLERAVGSEKDERAAPCRLAEADDRVLKPFLIAGAVRLRHILDGIEERRAAVVEGGIHCDLGRGVLARCPGGS